MLHPLRGFQVEQSSNKGLEVSYQLIAGERRLRAARPAGLPHAPGMIPVEFQKERDRLEAALVENVQRENLNPVEEAEAYHRLGKEFGLTQKEIAQKVSKSREAVANAMRLVNLPQDIRDSFRSGQLSRAHARALLAFSDSTKQREMYQQILSGGVSSKDVESAASVNKPAVKRTAKPDGKFVELERNLAETLGTHVVIQGAATSGGKIVIKFASLEDLNKIAKNIID